jgi:hypothetical protein
MTRGQHKVEIGSEVLEAIVQEPANPVDGACLSVVLELLGALEREDCLNSKKFWYLWAIEGRCSVERTRELTEISVSPRKLLKKVLRYLP